MWYVSVRWSRLVVEMWNRSLGRIGRIVDIVSPAVARLARRQSCASSLRSCVLGLCGCFSACRGVPRVNLPGPDSLFSRHTLAAPIQGFGCLVATHAPCYWRGDVVKSGLSGCHSLSAIGLLGWKPLCPRFLIFWHSFARESQLKRSSEPSQHHLSS